MAFAFVVSVSVPWSRSAGSRADCRSVTFESFSWFLRWSNRLFTASNRQKEIQAPLAPYHKVINTHQSVLQRQALFVMLNAFRGIGSLIQRFHKRPRGSIDSLLMIFQGQYRNVHSQCIASPRHWTAGRGWNWRMEDVTPRVLDSYLRLLGKERSKPRWCSVAQKVEIK